MRWASLILYIWILGIGSLVCSQQASSAAHVETLINQLGTGDIKAEDAAKLELMQHRNSDALIILLKALPSSDATVHDNIIEILAVYKDVRKIPALIEYWDDPRVESQLLELGTRVVPALVQSLPNACKKSADESYARWVGRLLSKLEPHGQHALLAGLASGGTCKLMAGREGIGIPRPGPPTSPPPTEESDIEDAGRFLLLDAAEHENPIIRRSAVAWIDRLKSRGWPGSEERDAYFDYSSFVDALIKTYESDADTQTRTEIARMLGRYPCVRVSRFMRAAMHSPNAGVRTVARKYLSSTPSNNSR